MKKLLFLLTFFSLFTFSQTKENKPDSITYFLELANYSFEEKDVLQLDIEPTELLFIDTLHTYNQLIKELEKNPSYNLINLFNFGILPNKPSSSGITVINKK